MTLGGQIMITRLHAFRTRLIPKLAPSIRHILKKLAIILIPLPLLMLFAGTEGIINNDSPEILATFGSLGFGFFNSFEMHTLIITGAFGVTFLIWFVTRNIWTSPDEESLEDKDYKEKISAKEHAKKHFFKDHYL